MATAPTQTDPISLDTTVDNTQQPISLDAGSNRYLLNPNAVESKAFKASYGLQNTVAAIPQNTLQDQLSTGGEETARTEAANKINAQNATDHTNAITQAIAQKGGPLDENDLAFINGVSKFNTYVDPSTVFETAFANTYTDELDKFADPNSGWGNLKQAVQTGQWPTDDVQAYKQFGSSVAALRDYITSRAQDLQSTIGDQSYLDTGIDLGKQLFSLYGEAKLRGNVPGVSVFSGITLDKNLDAQRNKLIDMPFPEAKATIDHIVDTVGKDNPHLALSFLVSMLGQDPTDRLLNKINTVGAVADLAGIVKLGSLPFSAASVALQGKIAMRTALSSMAVDPNVSRAKILASVGNIPAAAVEDASKLVANRIAGSSDITAEGFDKLFRFMKVDQANIMNDPGALTVAEKNALIEQYDTAHARAAQAIAETLRPGLDTSQMSRAQIEALQKETLDRYAGLGNGLISASDPFDEPFTNTKYITFRLGKGAGEFFGSEDEAIQYARTHGVSLTYTPEQVANLEARVADMKGIVESINPQEADTAGLNRYFGYEKQLKDLQSQLDEARANTTVGKAKVGSVEVPAKPFPKQERINELQDILKEPPHMEDDVNGLNSRDALEKELADLQTEKASATVGQQGNGYYIDVTKPVDYTGNVIRDYIYDAERASSQTPKSLARNQNKEGLLTDIPLVDYLRTAEDTLSPEQRALRKSAVYPQARLQSIALEEYKNIKKVYGVFRRGEWKAFKQTLDYAQTAKDPVSGIEGYFFDTPAQLQDFYSRTFGRAPTFREQAAYFATKRWSEYDLALREIALRRNKLRLGAETHQINVVDASGNLTKSPKFDGMVRAKFPGGRGNILIIDNDLNGAQYRYFDEEAKPSTSKAQSLQRMTVKEKKTWNELIQSGAYRLIELYNPEERPFNGWINGGENRVQYVLVKNAETSPLQWEQLPFRGGGHFVYDYSHYVKQAIVRQQKVDGVLQHWYEGDRTVVPVEFKAMGRDFADKMNQVRVLLKAGKAEEAQAFNAKHLPFSWQELTGKFKDGTFNMDEPFHVVPRNKSVFDIDKGMSDRYGSAWRDGTREGSAARNFQVQFTGERDADGLKGIGVSGTRQDPVFNWRPAKKIDPLETMNRSMASIIRSTFYDDYKSQAVEQWLREASPYLKATDNELRSSPFYHFKTATKDAFRPEARDEGVVKQLLANQFKINQLLGIPSEWDTFLHRFSDRLASSVYDGYGPNAAKVARNVITPQWALHTLRDPARFLRSITFNAYLGLFAPYQVFVQMASYVNMFGLSPRYATAGTMGAYLHLISRFNTSDEILNSLDKIASRFSLPGVPKFQPGEWKEAMQALDKTGFGHVGGEYGPLSTLNYAKPISSGGQTFLSWGRKPFQMGEASTRVGAWYMAFKEFRDAHPTGALTKTDLQQILDRADLYYGNMSSASNSVLHTGFLSLPTQFYAYTLRLAELFWSKRIGETPLERWATRGRLVMANAAMFGLPMGAGIAGFPLADYLRQEFLDNGYFGFTKPYTPANVQAKGADSWDWLQHIVNEGIPQTLGLLATGSNSNFGSRYGSGGFSALRDTVFGDAGFMSTLMGASSKLTLNTIHNMDGFVQAASAIVHGDPEKYPLTLSDAYDIVKEVSSVNRATAAYVAWTTGKLISKNGQLVRDDASKWDAINTIAFGLNDAMQSDVHNISVNLKNQEASIKQGIQRFQLQFDRGLRAAANNDDTNANAFFKKAVAELTFFDVPTERASAALAQAYRGNESLIQRIAWSRYVKNAKPGQVDTYMNTMRQITDSLQKGNQ